MKRIITACVLLTLLTIGCGASLYAIQRTTNGLADTVTAARTQALAGDLDASTGTLTEGMADWERRAALLGAIVRHNELYQIDTLYTRAIQAGKNGDRRELMLQTSELLGLLAQVAEMEQPTVKNVF